MENLRKLDRVELQGKKISLRADLNVPMSRGKVTDDTRIKRFIPTLEYLNNAGAIVIVTSHLGRPKGKFNAEMSLKPVAALLAQLSKLKIEFIEESVGQEAVAKTKGMRSGEVALLENLRFHIEEEANDAKFARQLADHADIYVNDAFSAAHRAHASTHAISKFLPSYAGPSMVAELEALQTVLGYPKRPVTAIIGGAKVSSKIDVLQHLVPRMDKLIIGGGMANTFLLAKGISIGKSLVEFDLVETARAILGKAEECGCEILLPVDAVIANTLSTDAFFKTVHIDHVAEDQMILDVGPDSIELFKNHLRTCQTLLWNGPLGAFEVKPFGEGTFAVAKQAAKLTKTGKLLTVAGGGDTVAALNVAEVTELFSYVSTAGGAFLEWLEGNKSPGFFALEKNDI
ncbi:MAG TPA: phosphoglycerate kinase [Deltaproteobacteria bacterium]|nr:phosphoglycerate kinase [Deltaproteobacteria bacterium]